MVAVPCQEFSGQVKEQDVPGAALPRAVLRQDGLRRRLLKDAPPSLAGRRTNGTLPTCAA